MTEPTAERAGEESGVCVCGDDAEHHTSEHNFVDSGMYYATAERAGDTASITDTLVEHSRCRAKRVDGVVTFDCGITVPISLAAHQHHQAVALAAQPTAERAGDTAHVHRCASSGYHDHEPSAWCICVCGERFDGRAAERAGDTDDVATVLCNSIQTQEHHDQTDDHPCTRCQTYAAIVAHKLDALHDLRAAIEALADRWEEYGEPAGETLRAVLGDPAGALAKVRAQTLRDAADHAVPRFNFHPLNRSNTVADWLRTEADRIEAGL